MPGKNYLFGAIFLSALVHLFWLSAVGVVSGPDIRTQRKFGEVIFLGPILENPSYNITVVDQETKAETLYNAKMLKKAGTKAEPYAPERIMPGQDMFGRIGRKPAANEVNARKWGSERPASFIGDLFYHIGHTSMNRSMEGPARDRVLLHKPELPEFFKKSYILEDNLVVRLKFNVSLSGNVEGIELVRSSGYPEVDVECMKYMSEWKFMPKETEPPEKSWGEIEIKVKAG